MNRKQSILVLVLISFIIMDIFAIILVSAAEADFKAELNQEVEGVQSNLQSNFNQLALNGNNDLSLIESQLEALNRQIAQLQLNPSDNQDLIYELDLLRAMILNAKSSFTTNLEDVEDELDDDLDDLKDDLSELNKRLAALEGGVFY